MQENLKKKNTPKIIVCVRERERDREREREREREKQPFCDGKLCKEWKKE